MTLKDLRMKAGLTTDYVADKLEILTSTYRKYECSVLLPSATILTQLPEILKCSADEIFEAYKIAKEVHDERYKKA